MGEIEIGDLIVEWDDNKAEKFRLISARLANKREVNKYYGQFSS